MLDSLSPSTLLDFRIDAICGNLQTIDTAMVLKSQKIKTWFTITEFSSFPPGSIVCQLYLLAAAQF